MTTISSDGAVGPSRGKADARADLRLFFHANLFGAIILQRFGLAIGDSELFLCLLIFFATVFMMLIRGTAVVDRISAVLFLIVASLFTLSSLIGFLVPRPGLTLSLPSLPGVLIFNAIFLFRPVDRSFGREAMTTFVRYAQLCCVLGIAQFGFQFIGIRLFTMGNYLPFLRAILLEAHYNTEGILEYGSQVHRANGIFLLEPGGFSQLIAVALLVDLVVRRRFWSLPLYSVAYLLSFSGTGGLCLAITGLLAPIIAPRQAGIILLGIAVLIPLAIVGSLVLPDTVGHLAGRLAELNTPGTSGYMRYAAQQNAWAYFSDGWRLAIGSGPGALERYPGAVAGTSSAAVKIFAEYGLFGLVAFATYIIHANWNRRVPLLSLMLLVIYQFGGGNLLQPPTLILMAMLAIWSGNRREPAIHQSQPQPQPQF